MLPRDDPPALESKDDDNVATFEGTGNTSIEDSLDPKDYCECNTCETMKTREESVCCKSTNYRQVTGPE